MTKLLDGERASRLMAERGIDVLVGTGYVNYGYITGYFTHFGRDYPGPLYNGATLVRFAGLPRDNNLPPFLITYPGEEGDIIAQGTWIEDRIFWGPKYNVPGRPAPLIVEEDPVQCLVNALAERGLAEGVIGIDMQDISAVLMNNVRGRLPRATFVDAHEDFLALRMIKTPEEIERLRGAVRGAERGHKAVRESLREGMTALELAAAANRAVIDEYTDRYILHVSCGEYGAVVLAPTETRLKRGQLVSVDVGSIHKNYIGDMFRVYAFGEPNQDALRIHESMDEVNSIMIESVRPGVTASELYRIGSTAMKDRGLDLALDFVGHGIGIDVHEPPFLVSADKTVLRKNMVIVIEVASRRFDLGHICAEIPVLVTEDGCQLLSTLPYTITLVP